MSAHHLLKDQTIIVTGAATGIGQAFALGCAAQGARVVAADMNAAGVGHFETRDHAQACRLAAARRAEQGKELACRDVERDIVDGHDAAVERLADPVEFDGGGSQRINPSTSW